MGKRGQRAARWTAVEDADIMIGRVLGKTHKGIAKVLPGRTQHAVSLRIRKLVGKVEPRPDTRAVQVSMRIPNAIYDYWLNESQLLGMTLSRYIREKLIGGR